MDALEENVSGFSPGAIFLGSECGRIWENNLMKEEDKGVEGKDINGNRMPRTGL